MHYCLYFKYFILLEFMVMLSKISNRLYFVIHFCIQAERLNFLFLSVSCFLIFPETLFGTYCFLEIVHKVVSSSVCLYRKSFVIDAVNQLFRRYKKTLPLESIPSLVSNVFD